QRGDVAIGKFAFLVLAEARVHDRAAFEGIFRGSVDQDRADAAIAFVGGTAAAADRAIEEVRVAEPEGVAELVGDDMLDGVDAEGAEARADVDRVERPATRRKAGAASGAAA